MQITDHKFRPYTYIPNLCVAELESGDTCNRERDSHGAIYSREEAAKFMLTQIREMEFDVINSRGKVMPRITSFGMLHDYIDANVGWSDNFDSLPLDEWQALTELVDSMLVESSSNA